MADSSSGVSTGCGTGARRQTSGHLYVLHELRPPNENLVVADGGIVSARQLDAFATARSGNLHSRLEAYLRATSVPEPARSAATLSARYSTLSELLSADPTLVADYAGTTAAHAIDAAHKLTIAALEEELGEREPISCRRDTAKFLKTLIGFRSDELLVVLFLDRRRRLIDHEIVAVGTADSVGCDQRRIVFRAIGRGASGIIVAHNHPSGDPRPSSTDINVTRLLADAARGVGICLLDHLVIAGGEVRSAMVDARKPA